MFYTQFNKVDRPNKREVTVKPSKTLPDMSLSVQRLLEMHSRGMVPDVVERHQNYSETEIPRFDDITERMEYMENLQDRRRELEHEVDEIRKKKEAARPPKGNQVTLDELIDDSDTSPLPTDEKPPQTPPKGV